MFVRLD